MSYEGGGLFGGAPVYPTVVESMPGCLRSDSAGSQKHLIFFSCAEQERVRVLRMHIMRMLCSESGGKE